MAISVHLAGNQADKRQYNLLTNIKYKNHIEANYGLKQGHVAYGVTKLSQFRKAFKTTSEYGGGSPRKCFVFLALSHSCFFGVSTGQSDMYSSLKHEP